MCNKVAPFISGRMLCRCIVLLGTSGNRGELCSFLAIASGFLRLLRLVLINGLLVRGFVILRNRGRNRGLLGSFLGPIALGFLRLFSAGVGARLGVLLGSFVWGRGGMRCTPHFRKVMALRSGGLLVANGVLQLGLLESILRSRSGQLIM